MKIPEAKAKLYQRFDCILGIGWKRAVAAGLTRDNCYTDEDSDALETLMANRSIGRYIRENLYDTDVSKKDVYLGQLINYAHSKRFISFRDESGKRLYFGIPSDEHKDAQRLNSMHHKLLNASLTYGMYVREQDEKKKRDHWNHFKNLLASMRMLMVARVFSKEVKKMFTLSTRGIKGVALTGNIGLDEVMIPRHLAKKMGIKLGDTTLVVRHPVQNLLLCCTVSGFTENEMRLNPRTIELIDGDFDGDEIAVVPITSIEEQMIELGMSNDIPKLWLELDYIRPSMLFEDDRYGYEL